VSSFVIEIDWEQLQQGLPEERATFGAVGLRVGDTWLTEAHDSFARRVRQKVHLSGYQLAYWLAWNFWRLRWEPARRSMDWKLAHRLSTIGGGYVWPNLTISSDGEFVRLSATPATSNPADSLRYVAHAHRTVSAGAFESAIDDFLSLVLLQLNAEGVKDTDLQLLWREVSEERQNEDVSWHRRLEAALGYDPDEAEPVQVQALIDDARGLGKLAVVELAASTPVGEVSLGSQAIGDVAQKEGFDACWENLPSLSGLSHMLDKSAWERGEEAARALRTQEKLGDGPLSDNTLAALAATHPRILQGGQGGAPRSRTSFALVGEARSVRYVLGSPIPVNRRFDLARLLGDRLLETRQESLWPVTRSYTYRQKMQRAFSAELLCPWASIEARVDGERSEDSREEIAAEFQVSALVVRNQLVNKGLLDRSALELF